MISSTSTQKYRDNLLAFREKKDSSAWPRCCCKISAIATTPATRSGDEESDQTYRFLGTSVLAPLVPTILDREIRIHILIASHIRVRVEGTVCGTVSVHIEGTICGTVSVHVEGTVCGTVLVHVEGTVCGTILVHVKGTICGTISVRVEGTIFGTISCTVDCPIASSFSPTFIAWSITCEIE
jgi:hypothetical protein